LGHSFRGVGVTGAKLLRLFSKNVANDVNPKIRICNIAAAVLAKQASALSVCLAVPGVTTELSITCRDQEWAPIYDDRKLFKFLIIEGAQADPNPLCAVADLDARTNQ
jgi:hypothetical protein